MPTATASARRYHGRLSRAKRCEQAQAHYGPLTPWWALATPDERRAALEAKLDREQPLPTYHRK